MVRMGRYWSTMADNRDREPAMSRLTLSNRQKEAMYRDGFLVLKKAVPQDMVTAARRVLNTQLGTLSQTAQHAQKMAAVRQAVAAAAKGAQDPRLLDLFNKTDAMRVVEALFGGPTKSATSVQISTRPRWIHGHFRFFSRRVTSTAPPRTTA